MYIYIYEFLSIFHSSTVHSPRLCSRLMKVHSRHSTCWGCYEKTIPGMEIGWFFMVFPQKVCILWDTMGYIAMLRISRMILAYFPTNPRYVLTMTAQQYQPLSWIWNSEGNPEAHQKG